MAGSCEEIATCAAQINAEWWEATTFLALYCYLSELFAVSKDEVHELIEGHELSHKHPAVLDGNTHTVVDERLR